MSVHDSVLAALHQWATRYEFSTDVPQTLIDAYRDEIRAEQATEIDRLRTEMDAAKDHLDHLERHTLPQLRREIEHHQDGKKRWRNRAEKAEAALAGRRCEVLREAADDCDKAGAAYTARALNDQAGGAFALMEHFLRKASEADYAATPCDFVACEPGGEPCHTHERLMAHAEGDHELCAPNCETSQRDGADQTDTGTS